MVGKPDSTHFSGNVRLDGHPLEAIVLLLKQACRRRFNRLGYSHQRAL